VVRAEVRFPEILPDPVIRLWDTASQKEFAFSGHEHAPWSVRFSPDGKLLASAAKDGLRLWDPTTGKQLRHIPDKLAENSKIAFSATSAILAGAGDDKTIRLWDVALGKETRRWQGSGGTLVFSPDGKLLASSAGRVWSTTDGKELPRMEGWDIRGPLAFSPTGRVLAAVGLRRRQAITDPFERNILLWEVASGQVIRQIDRPQWATWMPLAFSPDSRLLAFGDGDSTILLWDLTGTSGDSKAKPLTAADLDHLWAELAGTAAKADRALWALAGAPDKAVPFLKQQLRTSPPADAKQIAKLIVDLDSPNFGMRQKAGQALDELGEAAEGTIRKALEGNPALEVRQRLEQILKKRDTDALRRLRAIEALEQIGTGDARQVLEAMAKTTSNPRVSEAAVAAVARLDRRVVQR
jgi:HEAT repeats/WD domain, G-beta repeat